MGPIASAQHLSLSLGDKHIYRQLDLEIPASGCTVLMGPSGTGKSTLLRLLCGQMQRHPSLKMSGRLIVSGLDETGQPDGLPPALVSQKAELLMSSVWESLVGEWPRRGLLSQLQQKEELGQVLRDWGQQDLTELYAETVLSTTNSQRKRVAIVRKALSGAPLLLIDEPTAGMSDDAADEINALVRTLASTTPVLVVTHNQRHARAIADEVILMASGLVQEQAPAAAFFAAPSSEAGRQFLRTGSCAEEPVKPEAEAPDEQTAPVVLENPEPAPAKVKTAPTAVPQTPAPAIHTAAERPVAAPAPPKFATALPTMSALQPTVKTLPSLASSVSPLVPTSFGRQAHAIAAPHFGSVKLLHPPKHPEGGVRARGPRGFTWIQDDRLAGTPYPGILADVNSDLSALRDAGITHLISLTEQPFPSLQAEPFGIGCSSLPMADMGVPSFPQAVALCRHMDALLMAGNAIAVHCRAGLGRTGTMLAMHLIWQQQGTKSAADVIATIRSRNAGMIQSAAQEGFLEEFLDRCRNNNLFRAYSNLNQPTHAH